MIIARYQITAEQLKAYNPSLERFGIRRKMNLRIPVFSTVAGNAQNRIKYSNKAILQTFASKEVLPKETKWRLAYQYNMTIEFFDLNL